MAMTIKEALEILLKAEKAGLGEWKLQSIDPADPRNPVDITAIAFTE